MARRRAAKVDSNQTEIVEYFRSQGCSVAITSGAGDGFPDLVVGVPPPIGLPVLGINLLVEVKDGEKPPSARKLTVDQEKFHGDWRGQIAVIESIEQAAELLELLRKSYARPD